MSDPYRYAMSGSGGHKVTARGFTFKHRTKTYTTAVLNVGPHEIEVTVSPTGRSVHVHVNGNRWERSA